MSSMDGSQDESTIQPLSGSGVGAAASTAPAANSPDQPQRRSSAAAPTCPKRRTSKEDCFMADGDVDNEGDGSSSSDQQQDYTEELRKLKAQIAQEEAHLQSVVANAGQRPTATTTPATSATSACSKNTSTDSPQKPERRSSVMSSSQATKLLLEQEGIFDVSESDCSESTHGFLSSPDKRSLLSTGSTGSSMSRLPDYKMALSAVAQRYASGPRPPQRGGLSSFRSASTGVLPSATASGRNDSRANNFINNNDRPLGIPRRRESADIGTLCVLDEAATLIESPRGAVL
ncbi:MAG: hypothetical protein SGILL_008914 [Bacillariaceae sp.]